MGIATREDNHTHKHTERAYKAISLSSGDIRYILFRKCKCGDKYAYDLQEAKP